MMIVTMRTGWRQGGWPSAGGVQWTWGGPPSWPPWWWPPAELPSPSSPFAAECRPPEGRHPAAERGSWLRPPGEDEGQGSGGGPTPDSAPHPTWCLSLPLTVSTLFCPTLKTVQSQVETLGQHPGRACTLCCTVHSYYGNKDNSQQRHSLKQNEAQSTCMELNLQGS